MSSAKFQGLAESTRGNYARTLLLAEQEDVLGALSVHVIRPSLVQAFLDGFSDKPDKQRNARTAFQTLNKWARVRDLLPHSITEGCEAPGGDGGYEPWTDEQVRLAEKEARPHLARIITLASNTGQRGSDLVRMRWSDLEEYEGRPGINVVQRKTGLQIWIPFTQELANAVSAWKRQPTFIALKEDGMPWTRAQLSNQWERERDTKPALHPLAEAGCVLHGLRATAVVRLRRAGATTGQICDMVGMSAQMVSRYCRFQEQRKSALAAVYHLDRAGPGGADRNQRWRKE